MESRIDRFFRPRDGGAVDLYSARISPSARIADDVDYETLLERLVEFALRAAFARAADEHSWEQEELRRNGLGAVELFHDRRAVWQDRESFEQSATEGCGARGHAAFEETNELDPGLLERLDRDLQERWRARGYHVAGLARDMKQLFAELEADATDRSREAREELLADLLRTDFKAAPARDRPFDA